MAFQLNRTQRLPSSIRRVAQGQVDTVLQLLGNYGDSQAEIIHQVRVCTKRLRALLRLIQSALKIDVRAELVWFRNVAREFAAYRDTFAVLNAFKLLTSEDQISQVEFETIEAELHRRDAAMELAFESQGLQGQLTEQLTHAANRIENWSFRKRGWSCLSKGLQESYAGARNASRTLKQSSVTIEDLHELRKLSKTHGYHVELLRPMSPRLLKARSRQLDALHELLGQVHDRAVLQQTLIADPAAFGGSALVERCIAQIQQKQASSQTRILRRARQLYRTKSRSFIASWRTLWDEWQAKAC